MAVVATLASLLCLFAGVIVALVIIVVRRTRRRSGSAALSSVVPELQSLTGAGGGVGGPASTAEMLPINNRPAIDSAAAALRTGSAAGAGMRRPKSTNLEFYVGSFRYNNAALKDKEYCKPLVDAAGGDGRTRNEYTLC